jgi:hypothetical protein
LGAHKVRVGAPILQLQMDFFVHTRERFWYLGEQCSRYLHTVTSDERLPSPNYQLSGSMVRPPLHD